MFKHKKAIGGEVIISFTSTIFILVVLIIFSVYGGIISKVRFRDVSSNVLKNAASEQVDIFLESYLNSPIDLIVRSEKKKASISEIIILAAMTDNPIYKTKLIDESQNLLAAFGKGTEATNPNCYYLGIEKAAGQKRDVVLKIGNIELPASSTSSAVLPLPTEGYVNIRMIIDNQCLE